MCCRRNSQQSHLLILRHTMKTSTSYVLLFFISWLMPTLAFHGPSVGRVTSSVVPIANVPKSVLYAVSVDDLRESSNNRHATGHKRWGVDNSNSDEYWYDSRIHTLGNIGISGAFHAALAPISTKLIDVLAYEGVDIRQTVACELSKTVKKGKTRVVDLCCGVGISTRALRDAFPDAESVIGVDTSPQMISMASFLAEHLAFVRPLLAQLHERGRILMRDSHSTLRFDRANAEDTKLPDNSFDLVTIMYAFHEAPHEGRNKILEEARRLLQPGGTLAVVDISTDYQPSPSMLAGEPYVIEYQKNIHQQLAQFQGFIAQEYKTLVPGHVGMWVLKRQPAMA